MKLGDLIFGIKADKGQLKKVTAEIRKEFSDLGNSIEKTFGKNTLNGMEKRLDVLKNKLRDVSVGSKEFRVLQKEIQATEKRLEAASGKTSIFTKSLRLLGPLLAGIGFANVAKSVITLGANLEQAQISFEVMLGSAEKAKVLLQDLSDFAKTTPFELTELRENAKLLLAMGIQVQDLIPTMTILGNAAAGLGVEFNRVALAYGQVIAKGKLQGGELKQFTEAGIPLIKTLSQELGVSTEEFYKMVESGEITADAVTRAFELMSSEGGPFFDLMDRQSESLTGRFSNLKDSVNSLGEQIGTELIPVTKSLISFLGFLTKITPLVGKFFGMLGRVIIGTVLDGVYGAQLGITGFVSFFQKSKNTIVGFAEDLGANIGRAFSMIPDAIKNSLNKGIEAIEKFLNTAIDGVNNFARKFGINEAVGNVSLGRVNVDYSAGQKGFTSSGRNLASENNAEITANQEAFKKIIDTARQSNLDWVVEGSDILKNEWDTLMSDAEKQSEKIEGGNVLGPLIVPDTVSGGAGSGGSASEKVEKELAEIEKAEKKQAERLQKYKEDQVKKENDLLKKKYEFIGETIGKITDIYDEEMEKSSDAIDDYIKKIEDLEEKLVDISDERQKNKERLFDFGSIETQRAMERTLQNSGAILDVAGNDETVNGFRVGDLRDFKNLQDAQNKLNEQEIVAQQELENLRAKKEIEDTIFAEFAEKRASIDENYKKVRLTLESQITESVFQESIKQESVQDKLLKKWKAVAQARRDALGASRAGESVPGFAQGGYTGDGAVNALAGVVHAGEYVIPQRMVKDMPDVISALERMRQGGNTITNNKSIQVPSMVVQNQLDAELFFDKLKFKL